MDETERHTGESMIDYVEWAKLPENANNPKARAILAHFAGGQQQAATTTTTPPPKPPVAPPAQPNTPQSTMGLPPARSTPYNPSDPSNQTLAESMGNSNSGPSIIDNLPFSGMAQRALDPTGDPSAGGPPMPGEQWLNGIVNPQQPAPQPQQHPTMGLPPKSSSPYNDAKPNSLANQIQKYMGYMGPHGSWANIVNKLGPEGGGGIPQSDQDDKPSPRDKSYLESFQHSNVPVTPELKQLLMKYFSNQGQAPPPEVTREPYQR